MPTATGATGKLAIAKAAVWGTEVAPGAGHRCPFRGANPDLKREQVPNDDLNDSGLRESSHGGNEVIEGDIQISGDYRQISHMLLAALIMGQAGVPAAAPAGVYTHVMPLQPDIDGLFASVGVDYGGVDVRLYKTCKVSKRVITVSPSGRWDEVYSLIGRGMDKTIASAGWTYAVDPRDGNTLRVLQRHLTVRTNAASGIALGSGDELSPSSLTLEIARNLGRDFSSGGQVSEPASSDFMGVSLTLGFFGASPALFALFRDAYDDDTALKLDAVFDFGSVIPTTAVNYARKFYLPKMKVTECPIGVEGPGTIDFKVTLSAHPALTVPTGFPAGYDEACTEEWVNDVTTDPLA